MPSRLPHQATAEPGPLPSDPQGDASRGTMGAEGVPACMRRAWAAGVLAGAHATWHQDETMHDRGDRHMAHKGRGIFLVYVDIDAQHDKEFNEWYNTEHLPELLAVPGILAAARYQAVKGGPKSFGQKTPMRHFRGVYGPTTVRSLGIVSKPARKPVDGLTLLQDLSRVQSRRNAM